MGKKFKIHASKKGLRESLCAKTDVLLTDSKLIVTCPKCLELMEKK